MTVPKASQRYDSGMMWSLSPPSRSVLRYTDLVGLKLPQSKTKTKPGKKKYGDELKGGNTAGDEALDDPLAEKLRQQRCTTHDVANNRVWSAVALCDAVCVLCRLVEESDFALANELFGEDAADLEKFMPKSSKEFEHYATMVAGKYLRPYQVRLMQVDFGRTLEAAQLTNRNNFSCNQ